MGKLEIPETRSVIVTAKNPRRGRCGDVPDMRRRNTSGAAMQPMRAARCTLGKAAQPSGGPSYA